MFTPDRTLDALLGLTSAPTRDRAVAIDAALRATCTLVERVEGDPTTVIGLPLRTTLDLLRAAGVDWTSDAPG